MGIDGMDIAPPPFAQASRLEAASRQMEKKVMTRRMKNLPTCIRRPRMLLPEGYERQLRAPRLMRGHRSLRCHGTGLRAGETHQRLRSSRSFTNTVRAS